MLGIASTGDHHPFWTRLTDSNSVRAAWGRTPVPSGILTTFGISSATLFLSRSKQPQEFCSALLWLPPSVTQKSYPIPSIPVTVTSFCSNVCPLLSPLTTSCIA